MSSFFPRLLIAFSLGNLLMVGCYPYHYQTPYPGTYSVPPGTLTPGTPTLVQPGQQPTPVDTPSTFDPNWRAPNEENSGNNGNNSVPNYDDPTSNNSSGNSGSGFNQPAPPFFQGGTTAAPPKVNSEILLASAEEPEFVANESQVFMKPTQASVSRAAGTSVWTQDAIEQNQKSVSETFSVYDYDKNGYTWLSGQVHFDAARQSWSLLYNLEPQSNDQFGGRLTLTGPLLSQLSNQAEVHLTGALDTNQTDAFGRPLFRVEQITPLN